jgi:hypothetical protein
MMRLATGIVEDLWVSGLQFLWVAAMTGLQRLKAGERRLARRVNYKGVTINSEQHAHGSCMATILAHGAGY